MEHDQLTYYQFLQDLWAHFEERVDQVIEKLQQLLPAFFHQDEQLQSLSCDKEMEKEALEKMAAFTEQLPHSPYAGQPMPQLEAPGKDEGITTSGKVQYVLAGGNFHDHGYHYTGAMKVLETILRYGYLWTKIRVQGGAYGAGTRFDPSGTFYLSSYRDPKLAESLQAYRDLPAYLEKFQASDREMTKYVIGTISLVDTPLTPAMHLEKAITARLKGTPEAVAQKKRDQIIDCTVDDIRALAPLVKDTLSDGYLCVVGGEGKIQENKELFEKIIKA